MQASSVINGVDCFIVSGSQDNAVTTSMLALQMIAIELAGKIVR